MAEHEVVIETVAEVQAVTRETVTVCFYPDERVVNLSQMYRGYGDYQSILWPIDKTPEIIAALQRIYETEKPA